MRALQIVFIVSGFCGLIYESIWSQYLKLFVGHAAYAQTVVLVVFIGGMALGAAVVGRFAERIRQPLLMYAAVEATVGIISLFFHAGFVRATDWAYVELLPVACNVDGTCWTQWVFAALLILPQSVLLGTTFPLMTAGILRLAPNRPGASISFFYFLNSIGAVVGVLTAAFLLVPSLGLPGTLLTAGLFNIAVALAAYVCAKGAPSELVSFATSQELDLIDNNRLRTALLWVAALTGLSSFIYEIVWIRMLSLVIGASTDAFELMLAAFILGLALGGLWVRNRVDNFKSLLGTLAVVQVLMGVAALATLPLYDRMFDLLAWLLQGLGRSGSGYALYNIASHGVALVIMLPATILAGMTLPLITTLLLRGAHGERAIGLVYASNTVGAIVGVIIAVHFALPMLGMKNALVLGAAIDVALALLCFALVPRQLPRWIAASAMALGVASVVAATAVFEIDTRRTASGVFRHGMAELPQDMKIVYHHDGKTSTVDIIETAQSISIRTNGKSDAAIAPVHLPPSSDEFTMAFAAVLPLAIKPDAKNAAIIGFGSGMTTHVLLGSPVLTQVDTIEIEPAMVEGAKHFGAMVERAYADPRSKIVIDDAKSYFARSGKRYDLIVSEPSNPWVSGVSSLFTQEFYKRIREQLSPDGLFVQWIQVYEFSDALMATILQALDKEFADYEMYAANHGDLLIIASPGKIPAASQEYLAFPELGHTVSRLSMGSVGEIEARKLAGAQTVRAYLSYLRPNANSDYYPVVDHAAPRERFLRSQAKAMMDLAAAPVPFVEMLEGEALAIVGIAPTSAPNPKRDSILVAMAIADWIPNAEAVKNNVAMPRDIALLRAALWNCASVTTGTRLAELLHDVAEYVNPDLPAEMAAAVWRALSEAPCAKRLTEEDRKWLVMFEATGRRDAQAMAIYGTELAGSEVRMPPKMRSTASITGATGLIKMQRTKEAVDLLDQVQGKFGLDTRSSSTFQTLRGYALLPGPSVASR